MKKEKNKKNEKPFIKTRERLDGGREVEITRSPSKTIVGRVFAITIAVLTILVPILALIIVLAQQ